MVTPAIPALLVCIACFALAAQAGIRLERLASLPAPTLRHSIEVTQAGFACCLWVVVGSLGSLAILLGLA